jgi:hypothetical protein
MAIVIDNLRVAAYVVYLGKVGEVVDYHNFGPCTLVPCLGLRHRSLGSTPADSNTGSELADRITLERSGDALIIAQLR